MKTAEVVSESEQNRLVDEWYAQRPVKPTQPRPFYKESDVIFGIGLPMGAFGMMIGFFILVAGLSGEGSEAETVATVGFFALFVLPFAFPVVYVVALFIYNEVRESWYHHKMLTTGWLSYEPALKTWRKEGKPFYRWWIDNKHVDDVLKQSGKD